MAGIGSFWLRSGSVVSSASNREAQASQVARIQYSSYCGFSGLGTDVPAGYLGIRGILSFSFLENSSIAQVKTDRYGAGLL